MNKSGLGPLVAAVLCLTLGAAAGERPVVPNGDMEKVLAGITMPDLWYGYFGEGTSGTIELDHAGAHSGETCVRLANQTPSARGRFALLTSPPVLVKPGTAYEIKCFAKGTNVGKVFLRTEPVGVGAGEGTPLPTGSYNWREVVAPITTPEGCGAVTVQFFADGVTDALWVDDVSMVEAAVQPAKTPRAVSSAPAQLAPGVRQGSVFNVLDYGSTPSAADNTSAVQAAINACKDAGGGVVQFPAGAFRFAGTLVTDGNNVWLRGVGRSATTLTFDNGAKDCIVVGNRIPPTPPIGAWQTSSNRITDLAIAHASKTAGRTVAVINHADFILEKVTIDHCVVGVYAERINNVLLRDVVIVADCPSALDKRSVPWSSWVGVWWDTPPNPKDPSARSDVLCFENVNVQLNAAPGTGVLWDGMTNTFVINYANILHGKYGMRVINSRANKENLVPQFLNAFGLLIEGADVDLSIEAGYEYKFTTSDMDMCKGNTIQILPDPSGMPTGTVQIANSRIGNCQKSGIYIDAKDVQIVNTQMFTTSLAGKDKHPAIAIGPNGRDVSISNVRAEESIGTRLASYGVSIERGAKNIMIDNLNANYVNLGAIEDKGAINLKVGNVIEPR